VLALRQACCLGGYNRARVFILDIFDKKTNETPDRVIKNCQRRLRLYDEA